MSIAPQLAFNGDCRQAFELYADLLGGEITFMNTFGGNEDHELPPGSVSGPAEKVRFAEVRFSGGIIRGNDVNPGHYVRMAGFNVSAHVQSTAEARRVFAGLANGGTVTAPLTEVGWAKLFGTVVDRFGVPWLILALDD